jgi:hypothetical protein
MINPLATVTRGSKRHLPCRVDRPRSRFHTSWPRIVKPTLAIDVSCMLKLFLKSYSAIVHNLAFRDNANAEVDRDDRKIPWTSSASAPKSAHAEGY